MILAFSGARAQQVITWDSTSGSWSDAFNWSTGTLPTIADNVRIGNFAFVQLFGNATGNAGTLLLGFGNGVEAAFESSGTSNLTIGAGVLDIAASSNSIGTFIINNSAHLTVGGGSGQIRIANATGALGTLQIGRSGTTSTTASGVQINAGSILLGNPTARVRFYQTDTFTLAVPISGGGTVEQLGPGTTILLGSNTYTGVTTISAGTLQLGNGAVDTFGSIAGNIVNNANIRWNRGNNTSYSGTISGNGTLEKTGSGTLTFLGTKSGTGAITIAGGSISIGNGGTTGSMTGDLVNNSSLSFNRSNDITYAGQISGNGTITKSGAGVLTLSGSKTGTGTITISAGTLSIGDGTTSGGVVGNIVNGGTLRFNHANDLTYADQISGPGPLTKLGTGTLTLTGSKTGTSTVTITAGSLNVGGGSATGSLDGNVSIAASSTLTFSRTGDYTYHGNISGAGQLTKEGTGFTNLDGTNTHTGGTVINGGTLEIGTGTVPGSLAGGVVINNSGQLSFTGSGAYTFAGVVSGTDGKLQKRGTGTLILTGNSTYTGLTTISAGTLQIGNGATGAILSDIANSTALVFNRSTDSIYAGNITGAGTLTKLNGSKLTLTGTHTYTGVTTITGGTVEIGNGGVSGSISGSIVNNSGLAFNRSDNVTYAGQISGVGSVGKYGEGTLILTGTNSYADGTSIEGGTLQIGNGGTTGSIQDDVINNATFAFDRSDNISFAGQIIGSGIVRQQGPGVLSLTGSNTYSGGTSIVDGILSATGTSLGTGIVLLNGGTLAVGRHNLIGNLTVSSLGIGSQGGTLLFNLGPGNIRDRLIVNGLAGISITSNSTLRLTLLDGFTPEAGQSFDLIDWTSSFTSNFGTLDLPALSGGLTWDSSALYTTGTLVVAIPEPTTFALVALATVTLFSRRRKPTI